MVGKHTADQPRWFRRHPKQTAAIASVFAVMGIAAVAGAVNAPEGVDTVIGTVTDSGQYGIYPVINRQQSTDPEGAVWVENTGTQCNNLGATNLGVIVRLDQWTCKLHIEPGVGNGGDYVAVLNPTTRVPAGSGNPVTTTATTATTASTTATTSTTAKPEPDPCEHAMQINEIRSINKGCSVKGDIQVSTSNNGPWTTLYDDDPATGLVVTFTSNGYARTPWGANVTSRTLESIETELKSVGCVSGCTTVKKVAWPEGTTTTTTASTGTTTTSTTGSSTSTTATRDCAVTTIASGQTKTVPSGSVLDGDVKVNGTALYDNDEKTALRVVFNASASVSAEWGASYVPSGCEVAASAGLTVKMWPSGSTATTTTSATHNMTNSTSATATTATTTSTTASSTVTADTCIATISAGQTLRVKANCHVQGDVMIDGVAKYDNDATTGLIVVLTKDADVKAPWGASVSSTPVEAIKVGMMAVGCGSACASVNVVTV